jgi:hypothetical protein
MWLVRKGPTSHLPLHDNDNDDDTIEIPPTEILGRIFTDTIKIPPTEILGRIFTVASFWPRNPANVVSKYDLRLATIFFKARPSVSVKGR